MFLMIRLISILLLLPNLMVGQGKSFLKNYSPKDYDGNPQNWCIVQDNNGILYVGNSHGLLIYDGKIWRSLKLNNSIVRSLAKDKTDKIFYGAQGEFGYLYANSNGVVSSKSLVNLLPDSLKLFGDVWKTYAFNDKVIFQTFNHVYIYQNNKIKVIEAENYYHFGFQRNDDFYIIDREIGLKKLSGNTLNLVEGGAFFAKLRIYGWINYDEYALLVTREKGILKVKFNKDESISIDPYKTEIDSALIAGEVYCAALLNNENIAFGTLNQGLFVTDKFGKKIEIINKNTHNIKSDIINAVYLDQQNGLWIALDVGIARVEINNGLHFFGEQDNLEGTVNSVIKFNGNIYSGTSKGLFKISENGVKRFDILKNEVRNITTAKVEINNEVLFIVGETGTFKLDSNNKLSKLNDENGYFISKSNYLNDNLLIGTNQGLCVYNYRNNSLKNYYNSPMPEVRRIVEENDSTLWLGTSYNGVFKISNLNKKNELFVPFDTSSGLPNQSYNIPFKVNERVLFGTFNGIYEYDKSFNKFSNVTNFASNYFDSNDQIYQIIEGFNNKVWLFKTNEILHEFILYDTKTKKSTFPLRRLGEFDAYQCIYPEDENITWFGGPDGLYRYDASKPSTDSISFNTKIRGVYCMNDTLFGGYYGFDNENKKIEKQQSIPEVIYKKNNINFEFAALSFDNESENVYRYYLEGFENTWSEWTLESKKSYTNLNEGTYTFHVKSKNVYGKVGAEDTYTFTILPPWYRTAWAYLAYITGSIIVIYTTTQISVRRLKMAKLRLEDIVINRTAEVVAEKEEVEKQKKLVEVKNKDITDSINYAQKIQQAILPLPDEFSKVFPQSFIYFQPRDIVSGDFYWFYPPHKLNQNHVYLAAADCTGHGVPGAFMSMIGNTLLNEILNEKQIYECDAILNQLHTEVRAALKQDIAHNTTNDGMDIALCRIDLDTLELQYAGANRALYIFRQPTEGYEFIEVKPNKFSIGGFQAETTRQFNAHTIQLKKGDAFYMFSDGYADQFGGAKNKKFMVKRLQAELLAMQHLPLSEQKLLVAKMLNDWKGDAEQVDDILMIGVRV